MPPQLQSWMWEIRMSSPPLASLPPSCVRCRGPLNPPSSGPTRGSPLMTSDSWSSLTTPSLFRTHVLRCVYCHYHPCHTLTSPSSHHHCHLAIALITPSPSPHYFIIPSLLPLSYPALISHYRSHSHQYLTCYTITITLITPSLPPLPTG